FRAPRAPLPQNRTPHQRVLGPDADPRWTRAPFGGTKVIAMPNKPIWTEGILLSQHHFQQQDRYHESLLRDRLQAVIHYDWGVTEPDPDDRGLVSGQFMVRRFAAIWPDGTSLRCGDDLDQPPPAPRSFEEAFPPDAATLEVFLGLAQESQSALLAQDDEAGEARRFVRA